jgi:hypothetical protein
MNKFTPARRRSVIRLAIVMAVYFVGIVAANYLIEQVGVSRPIAFAVALIPGFATVGLFYSTAVMILETEDEFMRMLAVRQQMIAVGFAMSVACVWGFLEEFRLVEHVSSYYIVVLWAAGVFIGQVANRITHGVWGECP